MQKASANILFLEIIDVPLHSFSVLPPHYLVTYLNHSKEFK